MGGGKVMMVFTSNVNSTVRVTHARGSQKPQIICTGLGRTSHDAAVHEMHKQRYKVYVCRHGETDLLCSGSNSFSVHRIY